MYIILADTREITHVTIIADVARDPCGYIGLILREQNDLRGALAYHRRALAIRQRLGLSDSDFSVAQSLDYIGGDYLALAEKSKELGQQSAFCRQAKVYFHRALPAYLEAQEQGRLVGSQVGEPQRITQAIAKCNAGLNGCRRPPKPSLRAERLRPFNVE